MSAQQQPALLDQEVQTLAVGDKLLPVAVMGETACPKGIIVKVEAQALVLLLGHLAKPVLGDALVQELLSVQAALRLLLLKQLLLLLLVIVTIVFQAPVLPANTILPQEVAIRIVTAVLGVDNVTHEQPAVCHAEL